MANGRIIEKPALIHDLRLDRALQCVVAVVPLLLPEDAIPPIPDPVQDRPSIVVVPGIRVLPSVDEIRTALHCRISHFNLPHV